MKTIAYIVVNYKTESYLLKLLNSIAKQNIKNNYSLIVIIVSNNSPGFSKFLTNEVFFPLKTLSNIIGINNLRFLKSSDFNSLNIYFLDTKSNLGFASGVNTGLKFIKTYVSTDYLWILNPDTILCKGALDAVIHESDEDNNLAIVGSKIIDYSDPSKIIYGGGTYNKILCITSNNRSKHKLKVDYIHGSSMFMPISTFYKYGFFNEEYFHYYEEADFCLRLKHPDYIKYCDNSRVLHIGGASHEVSNSSNYDSDFSIYYNFRNRLIFNRNISNYRYYVCFLFIVFYCIPRRLFCLKINEVKVIISVLFGFKIEFKK